MTRTLALVALLAAGRAAFAQNLLVNPDLDTSLSGWVHDTLLGTWSSEDASGDAGSGSALLRNPVNLAAGAEGLRQCVPVVAGRAYAYGGRFRTEPGGADGSAAFALVWFPTSTCGPDGLIGFSSLPERREVGAWTAVSGPAAVAPPGASFVQFTAINRKDPPTGLRETRFDDLFLVESRPETLTLPALASIHGRNETFFQTDLWLLDAADERALPVTLTFRCYLSLTCPPASKELTLTPRSVRLLENVVGDFLGAPESAGALELRFDAAIGVLSASSRVFTPPLPAPSVGAAIPALDASEARMRGLLLGLAHSGGDLGTGFRTNAGAYNPGAVAADVTFTLYRADGARLGAVTRAWAAREAYQINDVFSTAGAGSLVARDAYVIVTSSVPVFSYATVIDNRSGDSVVFSGRPVAP